MRLDKFLKVSRIIKRRTLAKEITAAGKVSVNGRVAKPGSPVNPGDLLEIRFGSRTMKAVVLKVADNVRADEAAELYRLEE